MKSKNSRNTKKKDKKINNSLQTHIETSDNLLFDEEKNNEFFFETFRNINNLISEILESSKNFNEFLKKQYVSLKNEKVFKAINLNFRYIRDAPNFISEGLQLIKNVFENSVMSNKKRQFFLKIEEMINFSANIESSFIPEKIEFILWEILNLITAYLTKSSKLISNLFFTEILLLILFIIQFIFFIHTPFLSIKIESKSLETIKELLFSKNAKEKIVFVTEKMENLESHLKELKFYMTDCEFFFNKFFLNEIQSEENFQMKVEGNKKIESIQEHSVEMFNENMDKNLTQLEKQTEKFKENLSEISFKNKKNLKEIDKNEPTEHILTSTSKIKFHSTENMRENSNEIVSDVKFQNFKENLIENFDDKSFEFTETDINQKISQDIDTENKKLTYKEYKKITIEFDTLCNEFIKKCLKIDELILIILNLEPNIENENLILLNNSNDFDTKVKSYIFNIKSNILELNKIMSLNIDDLLEKNCPLLFSEHFRSFKNNLTSWNESFMLINGIYLMNQIKNSHLLIEGTKISYSNLLSENYDSLKQKAFWNFFILCIIYTKSLFNFFERKISKFEYEILQKELNPSILLSNEETKIQTFLNEQLIKTIIELEKFKINLYSDFNNILIPSKIRKYIQNLTNENKPSSELLQIAKQNTENIHTQYIDTQKSLITEKNFNLLINMILIFAPDVIIEKFVDYIIEKSLQPSEKMNIQEQNQLKEGKSPIRKKFELFITRKKNLIYQGLNFHNIKILEEIKNYMNHFFTAKNYKLIAFYEAIKKLDIYNYLEQQKEIIFEFFNYTLKSNKKVLFSLITKTYDLVNQLSLVIFKYSSIYFNTSKGNLSKKLNVIFFNIIENFFESAKKIIDINDKKNLVEDIFKGVEFTEEESNSKCNKILVYQSSQTLKSHTEGLEKSKEEEIELDDEITTLKTRLINIEDKKEKKTLKLKLIEKEKLLKVIQKKIHQLEMNKILDENKCLKKQMTSIQTQITLLQTQTISLHTQINSSKIQTKCPQTQITLQQTQTTSL